MTTATPTTTAAPLTRHPITWFEIPTVDLDRATRFYESMLEIRLRRENFSGSPIAVFYGEGATSGALVQDPHGSKPAKAGPVVYLGAGESVTATIERARRAGGPSTARCTSCRAASATSPTRSTPRANASACTRAPAERVARRRHRRDERRRAACAALSSRHCPRFRCARPMTRRADRLFQIAELLRGRRLTTAQQLAEWLAISPRTVYRDIPDLQLSGVPIEGEAGIGYRLNRAASLPPLTFTVDELSALAAGARMLESWGGTRFAGGARSALAKIASAMPADKRVVLSTACRCSRRRSA
ncbi:MAG: hypothetical protein GAK41_00488 [Burkholderia gladioli]|nr:MAG: hypothetical protein GAK41_00488 [Burkholderia gladioli]